MKLKALFVAPYAAMENLIETCLSEEHELDLKIVIGNLHEGVQFAKEAEVQGVDVIISRGGTAKLIGEAVDLPVIDVHLSGYDMLRVLTIANDFPRKKAIVGFSQITLGAKAIIDLLEIPIDIFTIEDEEETEPLLKKLKQEGYQLIMGDVVTFETAAKLGLTGILIQSGREAIFNAFKEAKMVSRWMSKNKLEIERLKKIIQVTASDFMVFSENGDVIYQQWKTFAVPPFSNDVPIAFKSAPNNGGHKEITQVSDHNGEPIKVIKTKIELNTSSLIVCEFSPIKREPHPENKLKVRVLLPPNIIHQSETMNSCLTLINRCLSYNYFILIGKRGTGKGLVAEYIHFHKYQGNGLFASIKAIDFLNLSPEMVDRDIKTIYFHSIEQLDEGLRPAFWRQVEALKGREFTFIFPMKDEQFKWGNLIYDDEVSRISIPSLADRKADMKELVTSFILYFNQTLGTSAIRLNEKGLSQLMAYNWPGNVKELKAFVKDAVLSEKGYVIDAQLIEELIDRKRSEPVHTSTDLLSGSLESIEKRIIEKVLEEEDFNQTRAAKRLNINRSTLWRKLKT